MNSKLFRIVLALGAVGSFLGGLAALIAVSLALYDIASQQTGGQRTSPAEERPLYPGL